MSLRVLRLEAKEILEMWNRPRITPLAQFQKGEVQIGFAIRGIKFDRLFEFGPHRIQVAQLEFQSSEKLMKPSRTWETRQATLEGFAAFGYVVPFNTLRYRVGKLLLRGLTKEVCRRDEGQKHGQR